MSGPEQTIFIIDDDHSIRDALSLLLDSEGLTSQVFSSGQEFLDQHTEHDRGCVLLDMGLPGVTGLDIQNALNARHCFLPIIVITGQGDIPMAVESMRRGALDFIRKPVRETELLERIDEALAMEAQRHEKQLAQRELRANIDSLTAREFEVFLGIADGRTNKVVAIDLGISERTVEVHRANLMKKLSARTLADLVTAKHLLDGAK